MCYLKQPNCHLCSTTNDYKAHCTDCYAPYLLETNQGTCLNCSTYTYYDNNTKSCLPNGINCVENAKQNVCVACNNNTSFLKDDKCVAITNNCTTNTRSNCEVCDFGISIGTSCFIQNEHCKYNIQLNEKQERCLQCKDSNILNIDNTCTTTNEINEIIRNNFTFICENGYFKNQTNGCEGCSTHNSKICTLNLTDNFSVFSCQSEYVINIENNTCTSDTNCNTINGSDCTACDKFKTFKRTKNRCVNCNDNNSHANGEVFTDMCVCVQCTNDTLLVNGICVLKSEVNCHKTNGYTCIQCNEKYTRNNQDDHCVSSEQFVRYSMHTVVNNTKGTVFECETTHFLSDGNCESVIITNKNNQIIQNYKQDVDNTKYLMKEIDDNTNCSYQNEKGCLSCNDGYYLEDNKCVKCANNCSTCFNSTLCLTCNDSNNLVLNNKGECIETNFVISCQQPMVNGVGCAICKDGYYYDQKFCYKCDKSCAICKNSITCSLCADTYFYYKKDSDLCITYDKLIGCKNKTSHGCDVCQTGYYLTDPYCSKCAENCLSCTSLKPCEICNVTDYVLKDGICLYYTEIEFCTSANNGYCTSCKGMRKPSDNGLSCVEDKLIKLNQIGIPIIVVAIVIIIISTITTYILFNVYNNNKNKKKTQNVCVFQMRKSNIKFVKISKEISTNKTELIFESSNEGGEILVNEFSSELLCLGNNTTHHIKMQLKMKEGNDVYEIQANPSLVTLKPNYACEFEISLKPNFTSNIEDKIACVTLNIIKGTEDVIEIPIRATTVMSYRLDYHELIEEKKIGEGSFGIVYKGIFRGNVVCIKKMKELLINQESQENEFEKEVSMLVKFKSEFIVHFFGAVFVPNKVCMVT
ncbi:protein serine/threonine kinase, putative [Entamoeba invadens IP1]|uniref:Protein serine/threonine kinase, putative n=1 Tax=Entamoeba invadens IP1 TaxID=370355 RepID=A0A0A1UBM7_ENTIV|nr:protein serine/threonine kinase, putative [Entamoeba invadens IP1]ELP92531.1 protein serine/threonine kinase, putative [Entamoeba invadens IP1]|eukprot:XP_004259302.1 protein serine/threonine kinase, putative [Entamoeba invadens IP1]